MGPQQKLFQKAPSTVDLLTDPVNQSDGEGSFRNAPSVIVAVGHPLSGLAGFRTGIGY